MADVTLEGTVAGVSTVGAHLAQSVAPTGPLSTATRVAPGGPVEFEFLGTESTNRIEDFELGTFPTWFLNCSPANGFTATGWNDGSDNFDVYDDGGNEVLRAQGRSTALATGSARAFLHLGNVDLVVRVRWYTGATAGLFVRARHDAYAAANDMRGAFAEIDSGGLRLGYYYSGSRAVDKTSAFSPSDGSWYWLRIQIAGPWGYSIRCKYWTGARTAEPASWNLEHTGGINKLDDRWNGNGVHVLAGTAYFDDFEILYESTPADITKLTAEFNGEEYAPDNPSRTLHVEPYANRETWFSAAGEQPIPDISRWRCWFVAPFDHDSDRTQSVEVLYDAESVQTWSFDTASLPDAPFAETGGGECDRIAPYRQSIDNVDSVGRWFSFLVAAFREIMGGQDMSFAIAPILWRTTSEDFEFVVYVTFGYLVDGQYWIAHPVILDAKSSIIPADPIVLDAKSSIVVEGALDKLFPGSIVPQGYKRNEFVSCVLVGVRFTYKGKASGVVSVEFLERFAGSGVVFDTIRDAVADVQVIDESTYDALVEAGVTWS